VGPKRLECATQRHKHRLSEAAPLHLLPYGQQRGVQYQGRFLVWLGRLGRWTRRHIGVGSKTGRFQGTEYSATLVTCQISPTPANPLNVAAIQSFLPFIPHCPIIAPFPPPPKEHCLASRRNNSLVGIQHSHHLTMTRATQTLSFLCALVAVPCSTL